MAMRVWILMTLLVVAGPLAALGVTPEDETDLFVVILPPWQDPELVSEALLGHQVGPERARLGVLLQTDHPDRIAAGYDAGAWWIIPAGPLAAICGVYR